MMPFYLQFMTANRQIYLDNSSITNSFFKKHIPSYYHVTPIYYIDDLKEGSQYFNSKLATKGIKYIYGGVHSTILSTIMFANFLSDARMPSLTLNPISVNIFNDLNKWAYKNETNIIGNNVNINKIAIIQSRYNGSLCYNSNLISDYNCERVDGSDGFTFDIDQKSICQNIISNSKIYVSVRNVPHFTSTLGYLFLRKDGLDHNLKVQTKIGDFLNNKTIESHEDFINILSTSSNCEG